MKIILDIGQNFIIISDLEITRVSYYSSIFQDINWLSEQIQSQDETANISRSKRVRILI